MENQRLANGGAPIDLIDPRNIIAEETAPYSNIRITNSLKELSSINDPGIELVISQRALPTSLLNWVNNIENSRIPNFRILVKPGDLKTALDEKLEETGLLPNGASDLFIDDISNLVAIFSQITMNELVDVRLDRIDDDACWKFHKDSVETRLLTTYRGPSTQWVKPQFSDRALREQKKYDGPLESLQLNDVAIFRGNRANFAEGVVHRSPPMAQTGGVRLLLCLNVPSIVSPEPWRLMR